MKLIAKPGYKPQYMLWISDTSLLTIGQDYKLSILNYPDFEAT